MPFFSNKALNSVYSKSGLTMEGVRPERNFLALNRTGGQALDVQPGATDKHQQQRQRCNYEAGNHGTNINGAVAAWNTRIATVITCLLLVSITISGQMKSL